MRTCRLGNGDKIPPGADQLVNNNCIFRQCGRYQMPNLFRRDIALRPHGK